jgi:TP901 family phage tail tape measure protein
MADVNANIGVNIDTSDALNQLKNLQRQISQFHQSVAKSSSTAAVAQRDLQKNFVNSVNAIQGFSAELRTVRSTAESFTNSLEKNKFSMREYFRYAAGATKTFGKNFGAEFSTIERTAIERVKTLQTQYIKMGRDAQGAMQAIAIRPTVLNMKDLGTQTAIAAQKQVLFNQLVKQGSTNLLNFGKNTQWAGRQLMVGFTLPLATLGMTAGRVFMDMEKAAIKFKKVYGDLFTAPEETQKAMDSITELGLAYTKYGVAVADSLSVAADAAAAGFQGVDLQNQTTASLKLSVLGQMELQKALETTIALQNAFRISSQDLNGTIDFLNAVENQTVVSLDDITEATPRVATVIQALGGDVKDLAFFLAAMKEGGVNAAQGANALKSGLASLINPTERASELLMGMGINIRGIVSQNQGDLRGTVIGFAKALDTLDPMNRAQAIEQLFGKFQFARISALFDNVIREGSQASRVLDLAGSSLSDLAMLSEKELGTQAASAMNKFTSSIERIKVALVPLGELFLNIATPFVDFGTKVLEAFNNLPDGMKKIIGTVITVVGGLGPVLLMTFGLINNGIANMIKFFATVRLGYLKMTGQAKGIGDETQYMTQEQLEASAAAASLDQAHSNLTQRFTSEKVAVDALRDAYSQAVAAGARFAMLNPGMMKPGAAVAKMAKGGVISVGGRGNKDTQPALLTPGEAVIPAEMVKKYQPLIQGMIAGNIPGYAKGFLGMPKTSKGVSKHRDASQQVYDMFLQSSYANTAPTEYGHQISPTSGHSFPIFGLGGVYQKGNKQVFVKPVLDEKAALAEMRSTEISRRAHGLEAPEQRIVVIRDPLDTTRQRRFLALESDLDPKFVNNQPMGVFNEEQYFRQLVASLLRVDKDLSGSNVYGNVVADAGAAGVFSRASGLRDYERNLPSMEEQAIVNLLGIKGGAKRAFAESTLGLMAGLNPEQYRQRMLGEIQKVLPRLKETIASFKLTNPTEVGVYDDMVRRLEQGLGVDWSKFHAIHSAVKLPKPKAGTQAVPGFKNGVVSVPGPKGAGDVIAAMLSPGEAVIPAAMAKKYAPLIQGMIAGNIPGYAKGTGGVASFGGEPVNIANKSSARALEEYYKYLLQLGNTTEAVDKMFAELLANAEKNSDGLVVLTKAQAKQAAEANKEINTKKSQGERKVVLGHLQGVKSVDQTTGERTMGSLTRRVFQDQNVMFSKAGQPIEEFSKDWKAVTGGLNESVQLGGVQLTESVKKTAQAIDDQIHDAAIKLANGGKITDKILEDATNQVLDTAEKAGGEMARVSAALKKVRDELEFEINAAPTSGTRKAVGLQRPNESELQYMRRTVAEGNSTLQGRNFKLTQQGIDAGISSTAELGRLSSNNEFRNRQRVAKISGSRTYLDNQSKDPSLKGVSVDPAVANKIVKNVENQIGEGLDNASGAKSPSVKIAKATNNIVDGVKETIVNSKDDVARATETMLSPVTGKKTGPRRASSDPAVMAALAGNPVEPVTQAARSSRRAYSDGIAPRLPGEQGFIGPMMQSVEAQEKVSEAAKQQLNRISDFSTKLSGVSFALSSLTGVASAFGSDLGGIMPIISGITGALFALTSVTALLTQAKFAETIATRVQLSKGWGNLFTELRGGATGLRGLRNILGRVAGAFTNMFPVISKLIIPLGIVATLFAGWEIYNRIQEEARQKVEGLGNVATLTADKIKKLGGIFGVTPTSTPLESAQPVISATGDVAADKRTLTEQVLETEAFAEDYKNEIAAISRAGKQDAELALKALAFKLSGKGFAKDQIDAIVSALVTEAGRTDVKLEMGSIDLNIETNQNILNTQIERQMSAIVTAYQTSQRKVMDDAKKNNGNIFGLEDNFFGDSVGYTPEAASGPAMVQIAEMKRVMDEDLKTSIATLGGVFQSLFIGLSGQLASGQIGVEQFNLRFEELSQKIQNMPEAEALVLMESVVKNLTPEMQGLVNGLSNVADQMILIKAASAGVVFTPEQTKAIQEGSQPNATDKQLRAKATALGQITRETKKYIDLINKGLEVSPEEALLVSNDTFDLQSEKIRDQIFAYEAMVAAGVPAADAIRLIGEETLVSAIKTNGATASTLASAREFLALQDQLNKITSSVSSGGAVKKSPFQEAIDSLTEQRKEIKRNIDAYAKLRNAGFGVAEASELAADSTLAVALAAQEVGSKGYNDLLKKIKQVKKAQDELANTDPQIGTDRFNDAFGKLTEYFDTQEALLDASNEAATKTNKALIKTLEDQIEAYSRQIGAFDRDLAKIAEKEDAINKSYDEKTKALQTVKKLNQDIINQQKSQLSIADALSQGDISAAASAMQDARAQSAAAQGDAAGTALDAARQSQLNSLTENGLTRAQIEEKIKGLKQTISDIEVGSLRTAQDAVKAADDANEKAKSLLSWKGQTRAQWEAEALAVEAARAKALVYDSEVGKALKTAKDLVAQWVSLDRTITTTHVINEVVTRSGGKTPPPPPPPPRPSSGGGGGGRMMFLAKGGFVKPQYFADGGTPKGTDTVPAMLTPGEFVVNRKSANSYRPLLESINNGSMGSSLSSGFNKPVYNMPQRNYADLGSNVPVYSGSGSASSPTAVDNSVYNYSLSVNVEGTNASANDIANVVMNKIKNIKSQQVRGQVLR